jgi:hypothetical protein
MGVLKIIVTFLVPKYLLLCLAGDWLLNHGPWTFIVWTSNWINIELILNKIVMRNNWALHLVDWVLTCADERDRGLAWWSDLWWNWLLVNKSLARCISFIEVCLHLIVWFTLRLVSRNMTRELDILETKHSVQYVS